MSDLSAIEDVNNNTQSLESISPDEVDDVVKATPEPTPQTGVPFLPPEDVSDMGVELGPEREEGTGVPFVYEGEEEQEPFRPMLGPLSETYKETARIKIPGIEEELDLVVWNYDDKDSISEKLSKISLESAVKKDQSFPDILLPEEEASKLPNGFVYRDPNGDKQPDENNPYGGYKIKTSGGSVPMEDYLYYYNNFLDAAKAFGEVKVTSGSGRGKKTIKGSRSFSEEEIDALSDAFKESFMQATRGEALTPFQKGVTEALKTGEWALVKSFIKGSRGEESKEDAYSRFRENAYLSGLLATTDTQGLSGFGMEALGGLTVAGFEPSSLLSMGAKAAKTGVTALGKVIAPAAMEKFKQEAVKQGAKEFMKRGGKMFSANVDSKTLLKSVPTLTDEGAQALKQSAKNTLKDSLGVFATNLAIETPAQAVAAEEGLAPQDKTAQFNNALASSTLGLGFARIIDVPSNINTLRQIRKSRATTVEEQSAMYRDLEAKTVRDATQQAIDTLDDITQIRGDQLRGLPTEKSNLRTELMQVINAAPRREKGIEIADKVMPEIEAGADFKTIKSKYNLTDDELKAIQSNMEPVIELTKKGKPKKGGKIIGYRTPKFVKDPKNTKNAAVNRLELGEKIDAELSKLRPEEQLIDVQSKFLQNLIRNTPRARELDPVIASRIEQKVQAKLKNRIDEITKEGLETPSSRRAKRADEKGETPRSGETKQSRLQKRIATARQKKKIEEDIAEARREAEQEEIAQKNVAARLQEAQARRLEESLGIRPINEESIDAPVRQAEKQAIESAFLTGDVPMTRELMSEIESEAALRRMSVIDAANNQGILMRSLNNVVERSGEFERGTFRSRVDTEPPATQTDITASTAPLRSQMEGMNLKEINNVASEMGINRAEVGRDLNKSGRDVTKQDMINAIDEKAIRINKSRNAVVNMNSETLILPTPVERAQLYDLGIYPDPTSTVDDIIPIIYNRRPGVKRYTPHETGLKQEAEMNDLVFGENLIEGLQEMDLAKRERMGRDAVSAFTRALDEEDALRYFASSSIHARKLRNSLIQQQGIANRTFKESIRKTANRMTKAEMSAKLGAEKVEEIAILKDIPVDRLRKTDLAEEIVREDMGINKLGEPSIEAQMAATRLGNKISLHAWGESGSSRNIFTYETFQDIGLILGDLAGRVAKLTANSAYGVLKNTFGDGSIPNRVWRAIADKFASLFNRFRNAGDNTAMATRKATEELGDDYDVAVASNSHGDNAYEHRDNPKQKTKGGMPSGFSRYYNKASNYWTLVSGKFDKVAPRLKGVFDKMHIEMHNINAPAVNAAKDFFKITAKKSATFSRYVDKDQLTLRLYNADFDGVRALINQSGLEEVDKIKALDSFDQMIGQFNKIGDLFEQNGLLKGKRDNYFHRSVIDSEGLKNYLEQKVGKDEMDLLEKAIDKRQRELSKKMGVEVELNPEEKIQLMNDILTGFVSERSVLGDKSFQLSRRVEVDEEMLKFYDTPANSYVRYFAQSAEKFVVDKYTGRLGKSKKAGGSMLGDVHVAHESDLGEMGELGKALTETFKNTEMLRSERDEIITIVKNLIGHERERRSPFLNAYKNMTYLTSITGFSSAFRNTEDVPFLALNMGSWRGSYMGVLNSVKNLGYLPRGLKSWVDAKTVDYNIDAATLGIDNIANEIRATDLNQGLSSWALDKSLKFSGFRASDLTIRNILAASSLDKIRKVMKNPDKLDSRVFRYEMEKRHGKDVFDKAMEQIKNNDLTEVEAMTLILSQASDFAPSTRLDVPVALKNRKDPTGVALKALFILKGFALKRADYIKTKSFDRFAEAKKLRARGEDDLADDLMRKGLKDLTISISSTMLLGTAYQTAIDVLLGREIDQKRLLENIWGSTLAVFGPLALVGFSSRSIVDAILSGRADAGEMVLAVVGGAVGPLAVKTFRTAEDVVNKLASDEQYKWFEYYAVRGTVPIVKDWAAKQYNESGKAVATRLRVDAKEINEEDEKMLKNIVSNSLSPIDIEAGFSALLLGDKDHFLNEEGQYDKERVLKFWNNVQKEMKVFPLSKRDKLIAKLPPSRRISEYMFDDIVDIKNNPSAITRYIAHHISIGNLDKNTLKVLIEDYSSPLKKIHDIDIEEIISEMLE